MLTRKKRDELREQPEEVRLRAATLYTIIGGAAIFAVWALVLLPLQVRVGAPGAGVAGIVSGLRDEKPTPTPTATPTISPEVSQ